MAARKPQTPGNPIDPTVAPAPERQAGLEVLTAIMSQPADPASELAAALARVAALEAENAALQQPTNNAVGAGKPVRHGARLTDAGWIV
jgi:hypothetical protein